MNTRVTNGRLRMSAGAAVLTLALAGCGGDGGGTGQDAKPAAASASPSAERALALADDTASVERGQEIAIEALDNDLVTLEDGTDAALLDTYEPAEFTVTVESPTPHGTVTAEGTTLVYTPAAGYAGEDEFTYEVAVKGKGPAGDSAVVRITVSEPTPSPTPKPTPTVTPAPKAKATKPAAPSVYYENCDAARAAGAAPVRRGDPGYAAHLDRDDDGVGCEPYGSSGGGSTGGSSGGGSTGGSDVSYANCTAVRAAGAAPIHRGDPGYGSHLDRDGDGVACE
ncbi:excalibur calcium-binding domain-containing protein [Streptomyces sp. NBC_01166]|uniref:excalibur calcium-binding domain-containing protein n=1 Tax=Streptomyces sp. NBC_01166 TaxID=2903755 RepID=UPI003869F245|nr:excalibur calcium-binding domain-containing protein [Streptomyces sp. NBC_01166]